MKLFLKKVWYFLSAFDHIKCVDCPWDGMADPYCKPPLGSCMLDNEEVE